MLPKGNENLPIDYAEYSDDDGSDIGSVDKTVYFDFSVWEHLHRPVFKNTTQNGFSFLSLAVSNIELNFQVWCENLKAAR